VVEQLSVAFFLSVTFFMPEILSSLSFLLIHYFNIVAFDCSYTLNTSSSGYP